MRSEEKMEEIHEILRDVWGRYISADEGLECIEAALHSVEAEKERAREFQVALVHAGDALHDALLRHFELADPDERDMSDHFRLEDWSNLAEKIAKGKLEKEAEKEPVTQEMIKAGLDAIGPCMGSCGEASPPDGEDVEACYLAMKELDQATTGMQAEKEPVNLPPAKPDLDPVEAHKRGEFVSDVEAAYNDGWNDCRHAAMYQTEKEPE